MTALAQKLARLKQQAGAASATAAHERRKGFSVVSADADPVAMQAAAAIPSAPPRDARGHAHAQQVAQLRRLMGLRPGGMRPQAPSRDRTLDGEEIAPGLRRIEMRQPARPPEGALDLSELRHEPVAASRILAFDTETTGLAGGTGTRAFMIGAADWCDDGLRIRQLCITRLAAEEAMLQAFAGWLEPGTVLLSYNGKSYDRPLLSTRYRLARMADPLPALRHVDLLHPMRRRYRGVWANCRLATAERELLGVLREDDLPGAEAPGAWLAYLRGGSASKLRRVGLHNAQDLRSLCGLLEALQDQDDNHLAVP